MRASTCEEVVGRKTTQLREWITPATSQKTGIRKDKKTASNNSPTRAAKAAARKEYSEAHKQAKDFLVR